MTTEHLREREGLHRSSCGTDSPIGPRWPVRELWRKHAGPGDDSLAQFPLSRRSTIGCVAEFVPPDFDVPLGLETSEFVLEPLGPEHNELDYDAWTSSMEHIAATPGYPTAPGRER